MKKLVQVFALILTICMTLAILASCSKPEQKKESNPSEQPAGEEPTPAEEPGNVEEEQPGETELTEIVFAYRHANTVNDDGVQAVEDELNKITEAEIGVHVDLMSFEIGAYVTQVPLMITGGEQVDLCTFAASGSAYTTMHANGQLIDMRPYLEEYAPDVFEITGDFINTFSEGGAIYGVPNWRNYAANVFIIANKGTLEELNLLDAFYATESWADYEEIMKTLKAETDSYPIGGQNQIFWGDKLQVAWHGKDNFDFTAYDALNDAQNLIRVAEDGTVKCIYDFDDTIYTMKQAAEWYQNGLAYPDSYLTQESNQDLMKNGAITSLVVHSELGVESAWGNRAGFPVACRQLSEGTRMITTSMLNVGSLGMPVVCKEPEATAKFINLMYTSADVMNLLTWGVEGKDYVVLDSGEAAYPNGDSNVAYHSADFAMGNFFLDLPWEGNGADFRDRAYEVMMDATISPYLGFSINTAELQNVVGAISTVYNEYANQMAGGLYTDELYEKMMQDYETAGLRDYTAAVQKQLDDWIAAK